MPGLKDAGMMMYRGDGPLEAPQAVAEPPPPRRPTLKRSPALQDPAPPPPPQLLPQALTLGGLRAVPSDWGHLGAGLGS